MSPIIFPIPKQRQKTFFWSTAALVVLFMFLESLFIFPPAFLAGLNGVVQEKVPRPAISINFSALDSDQVKSLEPFSGIKIEFRYTAKDKNGRVAQGRVQALNKGEALNILRKAGFQDIVLEEVLLGKGEPFFPYYPLGQGE